jgi:regulator of cell morphogenesis and NO signaling
MENIIQQSVASLVLSNHQVVPVLEKYSIDFCCKGNLSLSDACKNKGIEPTEVVREIESVQNNAVNKSMPFGEMSLSQLVNQIIITHHYYTKQSMPVIMGHLEKIAMKHGAHYPYMVKVKELFGDLQKEMIPHMQKEELVLFPRIVLIEKESAQNPQRIFSTEYISGPVSMMENEHEHAGEIMYEIRRLTGNYSIPVGACTTFRVCLAELSEFENDLHQHVHLENNILFPRAVKLLQPA